MPEKRMSSKDKLDQLLGIQSGQSIDQYLDDLSLETDELKSAFERLDCKVKDSLQAVDSGISAVQAGSTDSVLALKSMDLSMKEIEDLIGMSKRMFRHVYENIVSSDLLDSELISSAAKMLESVHINIAEFLQMYRDRQRFIEKLKLMVFQQEQKKELMALKHKYDMEKAALKNEPDCIEADDVIAYSVEDITRIMHNGDEDDSQKPSLIAKSAAAALEA